MACGITLRNGGALKKGAVDHFSIPHHAKHTSRPESKEELYNLCHASAQNVVEQVFGVLKKKWGVLTRPPQFSMEIQAQIPPAMCAIHNFIHNHDPDDAAQYLSGDEEHDVNSNPGQTQENDFGVLAAAAVTSAEKTRSEEKRDRVAQAMWDDYQRVLHERKLD